MSIGKILNSLNKNPMRIIIIDAIADIVWDLSSSGVIDFIDKKFANWKIKSMTPTNIKVCPLKTI